MRFILLFVFSTISIQLSYSQIKNFTPAASEESWPEDLPWWKRNNLRVMQVNLPAPEAALDVDHLINSLTKYSANTLIINAGGIMAFYPTELDFHYINPYMKDDMLSDVIRRCHELDIHVITRFDFSRMHKSVFTKHPDWCYISPSGERIINDDMYMAAVNAPYIQEKSVEIIQEVMDNYPIDGIFINMPGYRTNNAYTGKYHGIDQNKYDKQRFRAYSGGMELPVEEDEENAIFQKYKAFKQFTADDWMRNIHNAVKSKNPHTAICTYQEKYVDIIRHESLTRGKPYWPYMSFDNVTNTMNSQPNHIVSNASIQQISFKSRFNAIEPEEVAIRLYENIAAGSGLDMSMMGDFDEYEDRRNYDIWEKVYAHHKKYEAYYGNYSSPADICVISPSYWPSGPSGEEYRGILQMLKEAHVQYDIIEHRQIVNLKEKLLTYKLIIIPQIPHLNDAALNVLVNAVNNSTHIMATSKALSKNPEALLHLFGARIVEAENNRAGYYLSPEDKHLFKGFTKQDLMSITYNVGMYDFSQASKSLLPIYTPGRPGPPEKTGGHEPTGYSAIGIKQHGSSSAVLMPLDLGRHYYLTGYEQYKHVLLDVIDEIFPQATELIQSNAHERIELVLQHFTKNIPENISKTTTDGMILHLINLTGFSGNVYFEPLPVYQLTFKIKSDFKPSQVYSMSTEKPLDFQWENGYLHFTLDKLEQYDGIIIDR